MPLQFHSIETIEKFVKFISEKTKNTDICEEEIRQLLLEHPILKDRVIVNINEPFEFTDPTEEAGSELPRPRLRRTDSVSDYGMDSLRKYNPTGQHLVTYKAIGQARQDNESLEWGRKTLEIIGPDLESLLRQFNCIMNHEYNLPYTALQAGQATHGGAGQHQPVKIIPIIELHKSCPFPMVGKWGPEQEAIAYYPHRFRRYDQIARLRSALSEEDAETLGGIIKSGGIRAYHKNKVRDASHAASILAQPMIDASGNRKWFKPELIVEIATFLADADKGIYLKAIETTSSRSLEGGAPSAKKKRRAEEMPEAAAQEDEPRSSKKRPREDEAQSSKKRLREDEAPKQTTPFTSLLETGKLETIPEEELDMELD